MMVSGGVAFGSAGVTCDDCGSDRENGPAFMARVGGMLNRYLAFAGQVDYLRKKIDGGYTLTTRNISFTTLVYPSPASGFFLSGQIGQGARSASSQISTGTVALEATGLAIGGGIGYELSLDPNFAIAPYFSAVTNLTEPPRVAIKPNLLQAGIALTWHAR